MQLNLEQNEVEFIANVLGELPTKSNAFVLLQKIVLQLQEHAALQSVEA